MNHKTRTKSFTGATARHFWTAIGLAFVMATALAGPLVAQSRQKDKNNMRNLGTALGAVAAHQAIKGKGTNAVVLGAGAAYAGKKYEDARKAQSREQSARRRAQQSKKTYRAYKYSNGKRVGYTKYVNGKKVGYYRL